MSEFTDEYAAQFERAIKAMWAPENPLAKAWAKMGTLAEADIEAGRNKCLVCGAETLSAYLAGPWVCQEHAQQGWSGGLNAAVVDYTKPEPEETP